MPDERKRFGVLNGLSSTPNLLRRVGTSPTVAVARPWGVRDVFWRTAHGMCLLTLAFAKCADRHHLGTISFPPKPLWNPFGQPELFCCGNELLGHVGWLVLPAPPHG